MKIKVKNQTVDLNNNHYLAEGGEGKIYSKGNTVYKIMTKPVPEGKIRELSVLSMPEIIKPKELIRDNKDNLIGYTMDLVKGESFCKLFSGKFKRTNNLSSADLSKIVKNLQSIVQHAHSNKILIVDLNEFNFLFSDTTVYAIDVNSWQTKNYPAEVILEHIRDFQAKKFSEDTDWYSFGVLAFQVYTNIHPYKGNHPRYKGKPNENMKARQLDNISVLNPDVSVPGAADLTNIPKGLKNWFKATFNEGKRDIPPSNFDIVVASIAKPKKKVRVDGLHIEEVEHVEEPIIDAKFRLNKSVIITKSNIYYNNKKIPLDRGSSKTEIIFINEMPHIIWYDKGIKVLNLSNSEILEKEIELTSLFSYYSNVYGIQNSSIVKIDINRSIISFQKVGSVVNSHKVFDGMIYQDILGKTVLTLPENGRFTNLSIDLPKNFRIIEGKHRRGFFVLSGFNQGQYEHILGVNGQTLSNPTSTPEINMSVNDAGVMVTINENGLLATKNCINTQVFPGIGTDYKLIDSYDIRCLKDNSIFKVRTK